MGSKALAADDSKVFDRLCSVRPSAALVFRSLSFFISACGGGGSHDSSGGDTSTAVTTDPNAQVIDAAELEARVKRVLEEALAANPKCTFGPSYPSSVNPVVGADVIASSKAAGTTDFVVNPTEEVGAQVIVPVDAKPECLRLAGRALAEEFPE